MKKSILSAAIAALVLTGSAFAYSPKDSQQIVGPLPKLVPSKVVQPTNLPETFTRSVVNVEFSLDADGQPRDIKVLTNHKAVKAQVAKAFAQWKFEPRADSTGKRFVLPLEIVPEV